jgi:quercetin dioxygenase-like cupin family protein
MEIPIHVQDLVNLISYQQGSIVSKTLVDKKTGTITMFAFDQGEGLSEHTAPFDAMVLVLEGAVEISIAGRPILGRQGDMIIMPANEPHALKAVDKFKMILIMIRS